MRKNAHKVDGWVVIDKPKDMTSNAALTQVRHLFNAQKAGHVGTLDPFATGVLPIALGEATKLISLLENGVKVYEFDCKFGTRTTTDDNTGEVVETSEKIPTKEEIENVIPSFIGKIKQIPSKFSAIKINGQRAYDLARKGLEFEMHSREIEVFSLKLISFDGVVAKMEVICSKGTYVRTLGVDLAKKMGACAHLVALRRKKSGFFELAHAITLENLKEMVHINEALHPVLTPLCDITEIAVSDEQAAKLQKGQSLSPKNFENYKNGEMVATCNGMPVAVVRKSEQKIAPWRVFNF